MKLVKKRKQLKSAVQSLLDRVEDSVSALGVPLYAAESVNVNTAYLTLPLDLTEISSRELGRYMNALVQQKAYLRTVQNRVELLFEDARMAYFEASQSLYSRYCSAKYTETAKERLIITDASVRPAYESYQFEKARLNTVSSAITNLEDLFSLVSREVTRRQNDFNDDNRAFNVTGGA